jgi:hypothetical protein
VEAVVRRRTAILSRNPGSGRQSRRRGSLATAGHGLRRVGAGRPLAPNLRLKKKATPLAKERGPDICRRRRSRSNGPPPYLAWITGTA